MSDAFGDTRERLEKAQDRVYEVAENYSSPVMEENGEEKGGERDKGESFVEWVTGSDEELFVFVPGSSRKPNTGFLDRDCGAMWFHGEDEDYPSYCPKCGRKLFEGEA